MSSFSHTQAFPSFESAINTIARTARTQGFRIHKRKGPQKNIYEAQGLASFGCTAPGCGWFINIHRVGLDAPSTSSAPPPQQWAVYTLYDIHKSTCKPARSRGRRPSLSSISSLDSQDTNDGIPPELLRPYERSPSLPVFMPTRGTKGDTSDGQPSAGDDDTAAANGLSEIASLESAARGQSSSPPPDPAVLSAYIEELIASLNKTTEDSPTSAMTVDPQAVLTSLNPSLTFAPTSTSASATSSFQEVYAEERSSSMPAASAAFPFGHDSSIFAGTSDGQSLAFDLERLPDQLQRAASILQTVNPSDLLSPPKAQTTYAGPADFQTASSDHPPPVSVNGHAAYTEYAPPVEDDEWSTSDDNGGADEHFGQGFFEHNFEPADASYDPYGGPSWQNPDEQKDDTEDEDEESEDVVSPAHTRQSIDPQALLLPAYQEKQAEDYGAMSSSSSDSDIPLEELINPNTSRSMRSSPSEGGTDAESGNEDVASTSDRHDVVHQNDEDREPYQPMPGPSTTKYSTWANFRKSLPSPEPEEPFNIYQIFHSFGEAETAILNHARRKEVPLKIRYRPNTLEKGFNIRRQACFECLRLCGYRVYLKDDQHGHWRVINMEGGHKPSCYPSKRGRKSKGSDQVHCGTRPFTNGRSRDKEPDKDSMEVIVPVWEPVGGKRRRSDSFSSDRSSSPSIQVVTHSSAVMRTVKTTPIGDTLPHELYRPLSAPVRRGKRQSKKSRSSPIRPIPNEDEDWLPNGHLSDDELPPPLRNLAAERETVSDHTVNGASNGADLGMQSPYARKKLPTMDQLTHGSSRPGIKPRHKIPTKPNGRSLFKTRSRPSRPTSSPSMSYPFAPTLSAQARRRLEGFSPSWPAESSDDDTPYGPVQPFPNTTLARSQSSRTLRSNAAPVQPLSRATRYSLPNQKTRVTAGDSDQFIPSSSTLRSQSSATRKTRASAVAVKPVHQRAQKPLVTRKITNKMSLAQIGFSREVLRYLARGGYSTVAHVVREGLSVSNDEFTFFKLWLGQPSLSSVVGRDAQSIRQTIRHHVKTICEEVRVRSTIIWEAAGMMEEGSDAQDDGSETETDEEGQAAMAASQSTVPMAAGRTMPRKAAASALKPKVSKKEIAPAPTSPKMHARWRSNARKDQMHTRWQSEVDMGNGNGAVSDSSSVEFLGVSPVKPNGIHA